MDSQHWADNYATQIINRVQSDKALQAVVAKHGYIVLDEKTPSGKIHIGSGRGWVIHDAIAKALRDQGAKATFILSSDDMDPFDKMNADLPKTYEQHLGKPFRDIPSPVTCYKNFADYYFSECTEVFDQFGIQAQLDSTGDRYITGDFNDTIKIALDNADKINAIYERMYGKHPDKLPFNPLCEKCGKIGTTLAYAWDGEQVSYKCTDIVDWATGCGYEGKRSPYNGGGKFPWKVEWAAKWPVFNVVFETAGKDHFTKGGSRDIAIQISEHIFGYRPPLPSDYNKTGTAYEFFTIGGKKMSTSKGHGMSFRDSLNTAQGNILRYLLISTRPRAQLDFDPYNEQDLILLYDRYDKTERIYFGEQAKNDHEHAKHKRIYELSQIDDIPTTQPAQVPLTLAGVMSQVTPNEEEAISKLQDMGHLKTLTDHEQTFVRERLAFARRWVNNFAPDKFKFQLQTKITQQLDFKQKQLVTGVKQLLLEKHTEHALHEAFYALTKELDIPVKDAFATMYHILIGKDKGPRLASFMLMCKEKVISLLNQIT